LIGITTELAKQYNHIEVEPQIALRWQEANAFHADPTETRKGAKSFCIVIPPPNVTAALHMGHALNSTLQDILIRWQRMLGNNVVWIPGTDHAGIATQTVVEKRVLAEEGKRRTDFQRDEFVAKIIEWKDHFEKRITDQLKTMGCSCDWQRQRFTMDTMCAKAVREAFFRLFKDGLIYRGKRLVNWDVATQTALADDEVEMHDIDGYFWYMKYPLVKPVMLNGEPITHVTVATTRPETMLGDTAVAMNPSDPCAAALAGSQVRLPIVNRIIPIITDDYVVLPDGDSDDAKAQFATGYLKVTPAHDPNDWEIGKRHDLPVINVMAPDGTISDQHGWSAQDIANSDQDALPLGLDRYEAREAIVDWFRKNHLLEDVRPYRHAVGHSYRSHVPIEPYLSDQWYVKVTDDRLANAALRAMAPDQVTHHSEHDAKHEKKGKAWEGKLRFTPERYAKTFQSWHENLRDWCISRQLWWGHRIPVWTIKPDLPNHTQSQFPEFSIHMEDYQKELQQRLDKYASLMNLPDAFFVKMDWKEAQCIGYVCTRSDEADQALRQIRNCTPGDETDLDHPQVQHFPSDEASTAAEYVLEMIELDSENIVQDPDVLDTWFSSALWPYSTLGWPEKTPELETWNPGNVLCTAREIITLWVSRMVMTNLYLLDRLPFTDVFIHAMTQDGQGRKMSKSLGNGVDPLDIINSHGADAMRHTLAVMTTQTQDVRLPVTQDPKTNRNTSDKFDLGQKFANKLWNATRFALDKIGSASPDEKVDVTLAQSNLVDQWILSRLAAAVGNANDALEQYDFNRYAQGLYEFFWRDLCDWYIEAVKPTVSQNKIQNRVLAVCIDASLRLLHPIMPFITEKLWEALNEVAPFREISGVALQPSGLLIHATWPIAARELVDERIESEFATIQQIVTQLRQVRTLHKIPPRQTIKFSAQAPPMMAQHMVANRVLIETLARVEMGEIGPSVEKPSGAAVALMGQTQLHLHGLVDSEAERNRITKRGQELTKNINALKGRLANQSYLDKAPEHLVQQTRDQLTVAQTEAESLQDQLASLE